MTIDDWRVRYDGLNAEADRLRAEVDRLREDADRALWCEHMDATVSFNRSIWEWVVSWTFVDIPRQVSRPRRNAAIDAARGKA